MGVSGWTIRQGTDQQKACAGEVLAEPNISLDLAEAIRGCAQMLQEARAQVETGDSVQQPCCLSQASAN